MAGRRDNNCAWRGHVRAAAAAIIISPLLILEADVWSETVSIDFSAYFSAWVFLSLLFLPPCQLPFPRGGGPILCRSGRDWEPSRSGTMKSLERLFISLKARFIAAAAFLKPRAFGQADSEDVARASSGKLPLQWVCSSQPAQGRKRSVAPWRATGTVGLSYGFLLSQRSRASAWLTLVHLSNNAFGRLGWAANFPAEREFASLVQPHSCEFCTFKVQSRENFVRAASP